MTNIEENTAQPGDTAQLLRYIALRVLPAFFLVGVALVVVPKVLQVDMTVAGASPVVVGLAVAGLTLAVELILLAISAVLDRRSR